MLRLALLVVAGVQLTIGVTGLLLPLTGGDLAHPVVGSVHLPGMSGHLGNESAAFNIGIGIALGWVAIHPHRSRGPLPLLTAFVVVLAGLSVLDLAVGRVGWDRLAVHLPVVAGLLLTAVLTRLPAPQLPEPAGSSARDAWSEAETSRPAPDIGLPPTGHGPGQRPPAARADVAS
jgi:predicted anti-sigma-YlaC factor YlaD